MEVGVSKIRWAKLILAGIGSPVILYVGIRSLIEAYDISHPQIFIMYFFSASFMILTGLTLLAYFIFQLLDLRNNHPTLL